MQVKSKSASSAKSAQRKPQRPNKSIKGRRTINKILIAIVIVGLYLIFQKSNTLFRGVNIAESKFAQILTKNLPTPLPSPTLIPTPTPTPKPLSFAEMNVQYGPCVRLPVLMYHHVQPKEVAQAAKQTGLTVYTDVFMTQMEYLKNNNYTTVDINDLVNFFDSGAPLPSKGIIITFDDGYRDFYTDAFPILNRLGLKSVVFLPTGLMENPGYLAWSDIVSIKGMVLFANHTWSHKSVLTGSDLMQNEISLADSQLSDHGLNNPKIFAYPYGPTNLTAQKYLESLNYKAAFTTTHGNILCKKLRFSLPRIRVGNNPLSNYGF